MTTTDWYAFNTAVSGAIAALAGIVALVLVLRHYDARDRAVRLRQTPAYE